MTPTVSIAGVVKNYRAVRALRDVSFDLVPGRLSALVGHNGAGKTTLIKLMLGLIRPDRGSIRVLDEDPAAGEFSARRQLGYLPENVAFNAALTGRETLTFYARLKHIKPSKGVGPSRPRRTDRCGRPPGRDLFEGHAPASRTGAGAARPAPGAAARRADDGTGSRAAADLL